MRDRFDAWFGPVATVLAVAVLALAAYTVAVIIPGVGWFNPAPSATPSPGASATTPPLSLMRIPVPANADCAGCHTVEDGTIETLPIPRMGHPVEGWAQCTACHADGSLVDTAPGHAGLHRDLCLMCHQPLEPGATALPPAHHVVTGEACITCHGVDAPLPTDMSGRQNCWVCHIGADTRKLFEEAIAPSASP